MRSRFSRRGAVIAAVAAAAMAAGGPALAYVLVSSNGAPRDVTPDALSPVTSPAAAPTSTTTLTVSWTAPASQVTGAQYKVVRTTDSLSVCTVSTTSCADPNSFVPGTTYQYSVQTILSGTSWVTSTQTVSATAPDAFTIAAVGGGAIPQQTAGTAFTVQITAKKGSPLVTDTSYTGKVTNYSGLSTSSFSNAPTYSPPSGSTLNFTNGVATVSVTAFKAETASLAVSDAGFGSGAGSVTVVASGQALTYGTACSAWDRKKLGGSNGSTATTIKRGTDAYGNTVTDTAAVASVTLGSTGGSWTGTASFAANSLTSQSVTWSNSGSSGVNVTATASAGARVAATCSYTTTN